jgi:polyisoprenoid-binding protein YceI
VIRYLRGVRWLPWLTVTGAWAGPVEFVIDPVHTQIVFQLDHAGFSNATGKLLRPQGIVQFDEKNWANSSVRVQMDAAQVEFDDPAWNKAVAGKSFFDVAHFPTLVFQSTSVVQTDAKNGLVIGDLSLLGQTKSVTLKFHFNKRARHPYTLKDTLGFSAEGQLKRSDFGMNSSLKTVGELVQLRIAVEASRTPLVRARKQ